MESPRLVDLSKSAPGAPRNKKVQQPASLLPLWEIPVAESFMAGGSEARQFLLAAVVPAALLSSQARTVLY